jgi:hypothetical protein
LCGRHAEAHLSKQSRARPGKKHSRKKQATGNGRSEATHTVDHERITELLSHLLPSGKREDLRHEIDMGIGLYQSELVWSRHQLDLRDGIDDLGKMISKQMARIERVRSIAHYQAWKERLHEQDGGGPGIVTGLLPALDRFLWVVVNARRQINPKPGPYLAGRVLITWLIGSIESYTGGRIGYSYKDDLAPLLKEIVKAIDPEIRSGAIDEALRARDRGEWLSPVFGRRPTTQGPQASSPPLVGDADLVPVEDDDVPPF